MTSGTTSGLRASPTFPIFGGMFLLLLVSLPQYFYQHAYSSLTYVGELRVQLANLSSPGVDALYPRVFRF